MKHGTNTQSGFTMIELTIAIGIMAILMATMMPKLINMNGDARATAVLNMQNNLQFANLEINRLATVNGSLGATGSVTIEGTTITTAYGWAQNMSQLKLAMKKVPAAFVVSGADLQYQGMSTCKITYTPATSTASPGLDEDISGC